MEAAFYKPTFSSNRSNGKLFSIVTFWPLKQKTKTEKTPKNLSLNTFHALW